MRRPEARGQLRAEGSQTLPVQPKRPRDLRSGARCWPRSALGRASRLTVAQGKSRFVLPPEPIWGMPDQEAIDAIARINDPPNDVLLITAAAKAQLGDMAGARSDMAEFSKNDPDWTVAKSAAYYYRDDADRQHWVDGLRKAGLREK